MTFRQARALALAGVLVGISALVPSTRVQAHQSLTDLWA